MRRREFLLTSAAFVLARHVERCEAAPAEEGLAEILEAARAKYELPALAASVVVRDEIVSAAIGVRKVGDPTPVTRDDQFHLGSCTKSMTATLCGMFVEAGKLRWETTLAAAFPDLAESMRPEFRDVTLEHLLVHRAGLSANYQPSTDAVKMRLDGGTLGETPRDQRRKIVEIVTQEPPFCEPGTKFVYSNLGYMAAAAMLEAAADASWEDLMRKRIFEPLAMTTAGFGPMGTLGKLDQPRQHRLVDGKPQPVEPLSIADNLPPMGPAGRVHCSPGDWSKYAREHLRGPRGTSSLAKAQTFQRLHTAPFGGTYGGGWGIVKLGPGTRLGHAGSNTMNYCTATIALAQQWSVIVMTNQAGDNAVEACQTLGKPLLDKIKGVE
jgi:CubicO group peptidase (beta-lactamase class C family)